MNKVWIFPALVAGILAIGCGQQAPGPDNVATKHDVAPAPEAPSQDLSTLPKPLQNTAFQYYGLGRTKPSTYTVTMNRPDGTSTTGTGTETVKFEGMQGDKARFDIQRTGDLGPLGSEHVLLGADGITVDSIYPGTLEGHPVELPAKLDPGTTWAASYKVQLPKSAQMPSGGNTEAKVTYKVVGTQKVTTKVGTYDALLIESKENDTVNGSPVNLDNQTWLVKDRGIVKMVVKSDQKAMIQIEEAPEAPK